MWTVKEDDHEGFLERHGVLDRLTEKHVSADEYAALHWKLFCLAIRLTEKFVLKQCLAWRRP